jgi:hypothetical protein
MAIEAMTQTTIRQAEVVLESPFSLSHRNDPKLAWATCAYRKSSPSILVMQST